MKTIQPKAKEIKREKHTIDATGQILGRLATRVAGLLMGKGKSDYAPQLEMGDFVTVTNVEKIRVTGRKEEQKTYIRHSGYPGGFREIAYKKMQKEQPKQILIHAVAGMLPDNRLKKLRLVRLKFA